jgi:hypothetical protein
MTLLWEALRSDGVVPEPGTPSNGDGHKKQKRLPFETRCAATTRNGRRCRGRIRQGSEFCVFHDPKLSDRERKAIASKGGKSRSRLTHLPDGYLRKLTTRQAVGQAMDRLYREVRLEIVTPEMGAVLFNILTRILDSGLTDGRANAREPNGRSKADRIRPKLHELLTRKDHADWERAVKNAENTDSPRSGNSDRSGPEPKAGRQPAQEPRPRKEAAFQIAS